MIATTGVWDPTDREWQFLAGSPSHIPAAITVHKTLLVAVNEIIDRDGRPKDDVVEWVDSIIDSGGHVLIDSGIFWMTNAHMRAHDMTMDQALALPPDQIDGFDWLWKAYLTTFDRYSDRAWGWIELDQGGAVNKRITRAKLNDLGIFPMPVYHPLNDGWDYFDELASTHDRLAYGNIVQAHSGIRKRLLYTLAERHREYPDLFVHILGLTVNEWMNALPIDSCDSSTWLRAIRWFGVKVDCAAGQWMWRVPRSMRYVRGAGEDADVMNGAFRAAQLGAVTSHFAEMNWQQSQRRQRELFGLESYR